MSENVGGNINGLQEGKAGELPGDGSSQKIVDRLSERLEDIGSILSRLCDDSETRFIQVGRDLQGVAGQARTLTDTIRHAATCLHNEDDRENALDRTGKLIKEIQQKLSEDKDEIDHDLEQIRDLVSQISDCHRISDAIDKISASFRAVRINIRIQCSAQHIRDEMFRDVTDDIDVLSHSLTRITKEIKKDLADAVKNLSLLEKEVTNNLLRVGRMSAKAQGIVTKAYGNISQLLQGARTMMDEAGARSEVFADKIDEVVISIQFHDSLSQRVNHILHAFADITALCRSRNATPGQLGSAYMLLDLQHRQIEHIVAEITIVYERFRKSFLIIGEEVRGLNSILLDSQFKAVGPDRFLRNLHNSLQDALLMLCNVLSEGEGMMEQINRTAGETKAIAARLSRIMEDVQKMRQETRLQAVNTIIMASNLGEKGRAIQVLAKEISVLSDQTSELVNDVEVLQFSVNKHVADLCRNWEDNISIGRKKELETEVAKIDASYHGLEQDVSNIAQQINQTGKLVETVYRGLPFLQDLQEGLRNVSAMLARERDRLAPWKKEANHDSKEMEQLVQRYTMDQERLIHLFDRVDSDQAVQSEEDIFF